jgi:CRP/FNR family transcriptional regulator
MELNPASVIALTPVKVLVLSCNQFRKLNQDEPLFARKIVENISDRTIHLTKKLEGLALLSVGGRIADFLLEHANEDGVIYWQCTQNDIANRLGTVAEVVGRTLRSFADEGLILMPGKNCIVIHDYDGLREKSLK